jgi:hypothetical protein
VARISTTAIAFGIPEHGPAEAGIPRCPLDDGVSPRRGYQPDGRLFSDDEPSTRMGGEGGGNENYHKDTESTEFGAAGRKLTAGVA